MAVPLAVIIVVIVGLITMILLIAIGRREKLEDGLLEVGKVIGGKLLLCSLMMMFER